MKKIINQNEKGFLFKNGKFVKVLGAGKFYTFFGSDIEIYPITEPVSSDKCSLETLLRDETVKAQTTSVTVKDDEVAIHFIDGKFESCLLPGKYAFWNENNDHTFIISKLLTPEVSKEIPEYIFSKVPTNYYIKVEVTEFSKGRLYFNNKFVRLLDAGTYYFWRTNVKVSVTFVDIRLTKMDIIGQEILTQDKVSLRINFVCNYRITDYIKIVNEIDDYTQQIHVAVQLALREYVGRYRIDEILENKEEISNFVFKKLKAKEDKLFVKIVDAGVKDIILPGEIRDIMNTVLVAEKRAQANVIARREEVASTRSLLNTAKLMEENQTLYKLKELEYLERISEHVGNINVTGSGDILSQLANVIKGT